MTVAGLLGLQGTRGAPPRRALLVAVAYGAAAQLVGVALIGGATALLTWAAQRPAISAIAGLLVAVELVAFARAPLRHLARRTSHDLGLSGLRSWRTWLLDAVATWAPSRLAAARAGDLLARCLDDADAVQDAWVRVVVPVLSILAALVAASLVLVVLAPLAGVALLAATAVVAVVAARTVPRLESLGRNQAALGGAAAARVVELAHGAAALSLLGADVAHLAATSELLHRRDALAGEADTRLTRLSLLAAVLGAVCFVVAACVVPVGTAHPALPAGVLLSVLACAELFVAVPASLDGLATAAGARARLEELPEPWVPGHADAVHGALELRDVAVAPASTGPVLLAHVDLDVAPGGRVALQGPTGSGKSALLATAARLERRRAGDATLGGMDLDELSEASLRAQVTWLPTDPALLEGRVRDVVDVGRGLGDEELQGLLEATGLWSVLEPRGGLDAVLGPRAAELSGGERRRLAVARLLGGRPSLCLLDEPTAGLDPHGASALLDAIGATGAGVLVASHDARVTAWASTHHAVGDGEVRALER